MTTQEEDTGRLRHDPQEDEPKLRPLIDAAEQEAEAQLLAEGHGPSLGFCYLLWPLQQTILLEKHGIHWQTPAEMNPDVIFDWHPIQPRCQNHSRNKQQQRRWAQHILQVR